MKKANPLVGPCTLLLLAFLTTPARATIQYWSPSGTLAQTGGTWDTSTANWNTSFTSGGGTTWVQGNDAAFTVSAGYNVALSGVMTVGNYSIYRSASTHTITSTTSSYAKFQAGNWDFDAGSGVVYQGSYGFGAASGAVVTKKGTGTLAGQGQPNFAGKWILQQGTWSLGSQHANYFGTSTADDAVTLNGGTIRCTSASRTIVTTPITIGAGNGNIQPSASGVTVTLATKIMGSGNLTLNGSGAGAIVLANTGSQHSGKTIVAVTGDGVKLSQNNAISPNTTLDVLSGQTFNMNGYNASVGGFQENGTDKPRGIYTSATSTYLAGSGNLTVGWATAISTPSLDSGVNPSTYADPLTFSATATANQTGAPAPLATGTIQFYADGVPIGSAITVDGTGKASLVGYTGLSGGGTAHQITAKYSGATTLYKDSAMSSALTQTVDGGNPVDRTWTGASSPDPLWSNNSNWDTTAPVNGDGVIFAGAGNNNRSPDLDLDVSLRSVVFSSGASSYTLVSTHSKTLYLSGSITNNEATNPQTIGLPVFLSSSSIINAAAGNLTISSPITATALSKIGTGTLTLTSANTYSGGTTVSAGTLDVQIDGGLGSGNVTVASGATLKLGSGAANAYINPAANLLLQAGSPVVNLNFTGTTVIYKLSFDGGTTFQVPGTWGSSTSTADHKDSRFTGNGILLVQTCVWLGTVDNTWATAGNWLGNAVPTTSGGFAVEMNGTTHVSPTMNGAYTLQSLKFDSGAPSHTVGSSGNLKVTDATGGIVNASGNNQTFSGTVEQGATLLVVDTGSTSGKQVTLSGVLGPASTGGYTVKGNGILYLNNTGNNISGPITVNSGATLRLADYSDLGANDGSTVTLDGGTLRVDAAGSTNPYFLWFYTPCALGAGGGTFNLYSSATLLIGHDNANNHPISGVGKLTITGAGTLILSNTVANTYQGGTLIQNAKVQVKRDSNLGTGDVTVASGSTLELTANTQFPANAKLILQTGTPTVALSYSGTITVNALSFDGGTTWAASGVYGSSTTPPRFTGSGTITVPSSLAPVSSMTIAPGPGAGQLTITYSGGSGSTFVLLSSTDPAKSLSLWDRLDTSTATSGSFTITIGSDPQVFYSIKSE